ncbi:hypothetical protein ABZ626_11690 [Streptomyces longispororuber]|uniref:hypothetical protein n=1 Tax=Streptomyces longispororuber TaxID=68230 RepID=UPI00340B2D38
MVFATPASAVGTCSDHMKDAFDVTNPGDRPDQTYYVDNCVNVDDGKVSGYSDVSWQMLDLQAVDTSKRFSSFEITTRIEAWSGISDTDPDQVITSRTCDLTTVVNKHYEYGGPDGVCRAPSTAFDKERWWSVDSTVVYDIVGDGKGKITRHMTGSPRVH